MQNTPWDNGSMPKPTQPSNAFKFSAKHLQFDWIVDRESPMLKVHPQEETSGDEVHWKAYPFPEFIGRGGFENITLSLGMGVFRARHEFTKEARGQSLPLARIAVSFDEPTFEVLSARRGRFLHDETSSPTLLSIGPNQDLFRYTEGYEVTPYLDTNEDSELIGIAIGKTPLNQIIGAESSQNLLSQLQITETPKARIHRVPRPIQKPLIDCFDTPYRGSVRHLHLQSEILRYLAGLTDYLTQVGPGSHESDRLGPKALERAHALKDFLMLAEGKAPSMDKLALQFGRSSRALNDEFSEVFGQTIFGFLTQHRLELAYSAIVATDTPLKVIAERVGYAHVNHFSAAFKKRFGHPPGALRRSHSS